MSKSLPNSILQCLENRERNLDLYNELMIRFPNYYFRYDFTFGGKGKKQIERIIVTKPGRAKSHESYVNGWVFDFKNCKLLCGAMNSTIKNVSFDPKVETKFYPIYDGTMVNMYFDGEKWRLGTSQAIDVSNLKWIMPTTYGEAFWELFNKKHNIDTFSKKKSYTWVFNNNKFHPFKTTEKLELVCEFDLETGKKNLITEPTSGGLVEFVRENEAFKQFANKVAEKDFDMIFENADLQAALSSQHPLMPKDGLTSKDALTTKDPETAAVPRDYFGFIARNESGDFLYESELQRTIRRFVYSVPHITDVKHRAEYVGLKAYFTINRSLFVVLFPHLAIHLKNFSDAVKDIVRYVVENGRLKKPCEPKRISKFTDAQMKNLREILLDEHINKINMFNQESISIVRDHFMLLEPSKQMLCYKALYESE